MKNHLLLAQKYWKNLLKPIDNVIDATCGNGKDSLFLKKLICKGKLFCLDIQKKAIENTHILLKKENVDFKNIFLIKKSHEDFSYIPKIPIKLIVYNLGYLPKSDKTITTKTKTTLKSIKNALNLIEKDGGISITCYPGHLEGQKEENALIYFLSTLNSKNLNICYHKWINKKNSPTLIWIKKLISS
jgi:SAM-dependent methyltransferase